ncbi:MAG: CCA tRNA nucleotidyltransferase [Pirellulaceae bacterium]|nr:CCA tRNA nucleotidyltransferase [Pirellulaceae bacterium]
MTEPEPPTNLPADRRQFALEVVEQLRRAGHEALWAGGCVRDLLLERTPTDYDVATSAHPEQVRKLFGPRRTLSVGAAFGVIIVLGRNAGAGQVEVATFRNDAQYSDGRRPDAITFSTASEDAARRDFTINGMFYDPISQKVIDYVGGSADLQRGLIRAIGDADARIAEDKLRMLRAVRFAARFGFAIESATEAALQRHADQLSIVSGERMTAEMHKTLVTPGRELAVRTWASTGLLKVLLPTVAADWSTTGERICSLLRALQPCVWTSALSALLLPGFEKQTEVERASLLDDLKGRLKFSNDELAQLKFALTAQAQLTHAQQLAWSQLQPLLIHPHRSVAIDVLRARVLCGELAEIQLETVDARLALQPEQLNPTPLVDGQLLQSLGLRPGPRFKELINQARAAQLDGQLLDQSAAITWLKTQGN